MNDWKVGDRVTCINFDDQWVERAGCKIGETYTIKSFYDELQTHLQLVEKPLILNVNSFKRDEFLTRFKEKLAEHERENTERG